MSSILDIPVRPMAQSWTTSCPRVGKYKSAA